MKKNGFTLAEVLITLAIIGVVATMTLPALMTNTQEQQAKTGLKKAINTLTEAATMNEAIEGANFASLTGYGDVLKGGDSDDNSNTLYGLLDARTAVDYAKTKGTTFTAGKTKQQSITTSSALTGFDKPQTIYLRDGSAIIIPAAGDIDGDTADVIQGDNLPYGYVIVFDTNGPKQPNVLSNCVGEPKAAKVDTALTSQTKEEDMAQIDTSACNTKSNRVIKDQFQLRLRGTTVQPEGAASAWALNN
ncbi:type II secretion system protein [bacterium]|nr:type II secretion system protein [bacterium]